MPRMFDNRFYAWGQDDIVHLFPATRCHFTNGAAHCNGIGPGHDEFGHPSTRELGWCAVCVKNQYAQSLR